MSIIDVLVKNKILSKQEGLAVRDEALSQNKTYDEALREHGVNDQDIVKAKAEFLEVPIKVLGNEEIPFEILNYIPEESAEHYKFVPLGVRSGVLEVGLVEPDNIEARDALNFISSKINLSYKMFLITEEDLQKVLQMYKGLSGEVTKALDDLDSQFSDEDVDIIKPTSNKPGVPGRPGQFGIQAQETTIIEDAPVTKIVATILRYAIDGNASDVHIEHVRDKVRVRFRVDGVLQTSLELPSKVHSAVVARIKILSDMKLDEKRKPQDGRFTARIEGRKVDFRVSTFPAYYGEKIVMRILDQERGVQKLDDMGISPRNLALIKEAITKPYGLILITGPTGSGKSTTLYSMLNELDREGMNVLSLEDPVEYNIDGVSQSQVHPEIGYTFATGLRTTLRQDPDVIMVGEIRDKETAQLAVQAALTGHLVLSTLHTNTSIGAIPRLIDMGVDPYLIAPTLILTMAQRLVAKICPGTGKPRKIEGSLKMLIDKEFQGIPAEFRKEIPPMDEVLEIQPTDECPKGVRGRAAVFEVFHMNKDLEAMILKSPNETDLFPVARKQGMFTMKEDAYMKALRKEIPLEEVNKL